MAKSLKTMYTEENIHRRRHRSNIRSRRQVISLAKGPRSDGTRNVAIAVQSPHDVYHRLFCWLYFPCSDPRGYRAFRRGLSDAGQFTTGRWMSGISVPEGIARDHTSFELLETPTPVTPLDSKEQRDNTTRTSKSFIK